MGNERNSLRSLRGQRSFPFATVRDDGVGSENPLGKVDTFVTLHSIKKLGGSTDRRTFLKSATIGTVAVGIARAAFAVEKYFPVKADQRLPRDT